MVLVLSQSISQAFSGVGGLGRVGSVERVEQGSNRDAPAGHELGSRPPQRRRERDRPEVLVQHHRGSAARLDNGGDLVQVIGPDETRGRALEDPEVELALAQLFDLEAGDGPSACLRRNARSRMRTVPWSTRSMSRGNTSFGIFVSGNSTTM
jgi:hypothetical protein